MELSDSAYPLLTQINGVTNYEDGFKLFFFNYIFRGC